MLNLGDTVTMLQTRGFDGIPVDYLQRYVRWGWRDIMHKGPWGFQDTEVSLADLTDAKVAASELTGLIVIRNVYITDKWALQPMSREYFRRVYQAAYGTDQYTTGTPMHYVVLEDGSMYFDRTPQSETVVVVGYAPAVDADDEEVTSNARFWEDFESALFYAAESHCHHHARQYEHETRSIARAMEIVDDLLNSMSMYYNAEPERVQPDDRWI